MIFPFAGIATDLTHADVAEVTAGMTTARWAGEVPLSWIELSLIWLLQENVSVSKLFGRSDASSGHDQYPHIVHMPDGRFVVEDGHCRIVRAALAARRTPTPPSTFARILIPA